MERAVILGDGKALEVTTALGHGLPPREAAAPLPFTGREAGGPDELSPRFNGSVIPTLDEAIVAHIEATLRITQGRIEGPQGAARLLNVNPHTLRARMRKLHIAWSAYRTANRSECS